MEISCWKFLACKLPIPKHLTPKRRLEHYIPKNSLKLMNRETKEKEKKEDQKGENLETQNDKCEDEKVILCSECEYTTKIKYYLLRHITSRHGPLSFKCDICTKGLRTSRQLKIHIKEKHSGRQAGKEAGKGIWL